MESYIIINLVKDYYFQNSDKKIVKQCTFLNSKRIKFLIIEFKYIKIIYVFYNKHK